MINKSTLLRIIENSKPAAREDPSASKRGWYICLDQNDGMYYLNRIGDVTRGVGHPSSYFWSSKELADNFIAKWLEPIKGE